MERPLPATAALFRLLLPDILSSSEAQGKDVQAIRQPFPCLPRSTMTTRAPRPSVRLPRPAPRPSSPAIASAPFMITESSGGPRPAKPPRS